jgi:hypothetical protein
MENKYIFSEIRERGRKKVYMFLLYTTRTEKAVDIHSPGGDYQNVVGGYSDLLVKYFIYIYFEREFMSNAITKIRL